MAVKEPSTAIPCRHCTGQPAARSGQSGVILLMVVLVLAGVFILALPLAFLSRSAERSNEQLLDRSTARRYAELALEHARNRLRLGIHDNEYRYLHPIPTSAPTPEPSVIARRAPYDTPEHDGMAELYFDRKQEWRYLMGGDFLQHPDGIIVDVDVEDEQGKLNINSLTPGLLMGLYLAVTGIDPADLDDTERSKLKDLYNNCITPLALLRFQGDKYVPLSSFDEFRNSIPGRMLTDSEAELLRPNLTVYSWRPTDTGFPRSYSLYNYATYVENGYIHTGIRVSDENKGLMPYYHFLALDASRRVLADYYLPALDLNGDYVTYLPLGLPDETALISREPEYFHDLNTNTCSREVFMALLLAGIDLDAPLCSLEEARETARIMLPQGYIDDMQDNGGTWTLHLSPDSDIDCFEPSPSLSIGGRYSVCTLSGENLTIPEYVGDALADLCTPPFPVRAVRPYSGTFSFGLHDKSEFMAKRVLYLQTTANMITLTTVSHDIYTVTARASVNSYFGMENGSYTIKEVLELGRGKRSDEAITLVDDYLDLTTTLTSIYRGRNYRKLGSWSVSNINPNGYNQLNETYPPEIGVRNIRSYTLPDAQYYLLRPRGAATNSTFFSGSSTSIASSTLFEANTAVDSSVVFTKGGENLNIVKIGAAPIYSASSSGVAFYTWISALGWEPATEANKRYIYTIRPSSEVNGKGKVELYTEGGDLILMVTDDNGAWGRLKYKLTTSNMPKDTWMYIGFHASGNQPGQMALFVDNVLADAEYESSDTRGYCLELAGDLALTWAALVVELAEDGLAMNVTSTEGFPTSGYLRIEDEIIYYASKTTTGFLGLRRGAAGTEAATHAITTEFRAAIAIKYDPLPEDVPKKDDTVTLYSYSVLGMTDSPYGSTSTIAFYGRGAVAVTFTLDRDAGFDSATSKWIISPSSNTFADTMLTSDTSLNGSTNRLFALFGISGTLPTGDFETGKINVVALSPSSGEEAFYGKYSEIGVIRPRTGARRLQTALAQDTQTIPASEVFGGVSLGDTGLIVVDEELMLFRLEEPNLVLMRGRLGSTAAQHAAGAWVMPISLYRTALMEDQLSATTTVASYSTATYTNTASTYLRLDDEIILYARKSGESGAPPYKVELLRGCYGTTPTSHEEKSVAVVFPTQGTFAYDLTGATGIESDYLEFVRRKAGSRYRALTWSNLVDSDKIRMHWWVSVDGNRNFTYDANAPSGTPKYGMFHFDTSSGDFSISRDGAPVVSDFVIIRMIPEYLPGSWKPNDPTVHDWKIAPVLDKIEIWCEDPDVVFLHEEGY